MMNRKIYIAIAAIGAPLIIISFLVSYLYPYMISRNSDTYRIVPEYERQMKKIVISLDKNTPSLNLHSEFLNSLPGYTEILLLLPEGSKKAVMDEIKNRPYRDRVRLHEFKTHKLKNADIYLLFPEKDKFISTYSVDAVMPYGSLWAQDLFESAVTPDGKTTLLISDLHKWFISENTRKPYMVKSDNAFIGNLISHDTDVKRLPVTFKGGNILIDVVNDKRIAFCGGDVLRQTRTVWKSTKGNVPMDNEIIALLKQHLNVDEVVVVGQGKKQPAVMFHLDQAMALLPGRVALITSIADGNNDDTVNTDEIREAKNFLSGLRTELQTRGYKIVDIQTSAQNVSDYQYYVNGIPFIHAETGQHTFYMPVFASSDSPQNKSNINKNVAAIKELGYNVVQIPTAADSINGGLHCLVNVIT